mmetsp:Transcript_36353/g.87723  ORF Transcript_36353/g.87723 Transcript_36353/m.87723 type:complete len:220 (+) Transcript_36353:1919-2578(+)
MPAPLMLPPTRPLHSNHPEIPFRLRHKKLLSQPTTVALILTSSRLLLLQSHHREKCCKKTPRKILHFRTKTSPSSVHRIAHLPLKDSKHVNGRVGQDRAVTHRVPRHAKTPPAPWRFVPYTSRASRLPSCIRAEALWRQKEEVHSCNRPPPRWRMLCPRKTTSLWRTTHPKLTSPWWRKGDRIPTRPRRRHRNYPLRRQPTYPRSAPTNRSRPIQRPQA